MIQSAPLCNCGHTHVYSGIIYVDCPTCKECCGHTNINANVTRVFKLSRFRSYVKRTGFEHANLGAI